MNIFKKQMTSFELTTLVVFIIYLILPMKTPTSVSYWLNKPVGILAIFVITVYLFMYAHPALGVLYLFVAYELLRRSCSIFVPKYNPLGTSYTKMPMNPYTESKYTNNELIQNEADDLYYANKVDELNQIDTSYGPIGVNSKKIDEHNYPKEDDIVTDIHYENLEEEVVSKKDPNSVLGEMSAIFPQNKKFVATYDISTLSASQI
jgi:hypothetical protein